MKIGYVRVSTRDQNPIAQHDALTRWREGRDIFVRNALVLIPVTVVILSSLGCGISDQTDQSLPDDRATAIPVVEAYLQALSQHDGDGVRALITSSADERGVSDRLGLYGGSPSIASLRRGRRMRVRALHLVVD